MAQETPDTHFKALQVNLDPARYGTFAEIGAGQEVARWFFRVGGAAGTDRQGDVGLRHDLQRRHLRPERSLRQPAAAADDARSRVRPADRAARRQARRQDPVLRLRRHGGHAQLLAQGRRPRLARHPLPDRAARDRRRRSPFTSGSPTARPSSSRRRSASSASTWSTARSSSTPTRAALIASLLDNLTPARVEVDMIEFSGPAFAGVDNRLMSLELVRTGLTHAAMFAADGRVVQPSDALYKKCVLVERGSFRPATKVTVDMLRCAQAQFVQEPGVQGEDVVVLFEMTLRNLRERAGRDRRAGLPRSRRHPGDARPDGAHLELRRVPPAGGVPVPLHQEADRHRDGRADAARAVRRELLRRPRWRHSGVVRAAVQERPEDLRLPAARRDDRRAHHRRQPARGTAPAAPLRVPGREPPDREHPRFRPAMPVASTRATCSRAFAAATRSGKR